MSAWGGSVSSTALVTKAEVGDLQVDCACFRWGCFQGGEGWISMAARVFASGGALPPLL